ncbi:MAG: hypothetical protein FJ298_12510 [Planctomycetes bacterium]|nr:hypothetical protein [Planctomycetota bacterium]
MKLKPLLGAVVLLGALFAAHRYLNHGPSSRGSLEVSPSNDSTTKSTAGPSTTPVAEREQFRVGFLPVT